MRFELPESLLTSQTELLEAALPLHPPRHERPSDRHLLGWLPVRNLHDRHRPRVLRHLLSLAPEDRQLRFGHVASDSQIARYVQTMDFSRDHVLGVFNRRLQIVALAHLAMRSDQLEGEFGVSVLATNRGRGMGQKLFQHAVVHARNKGAASLCIHLDRNNRAMLAIVQKAGAKLDTSGSEVEARLALEKATWGTQVEEMMESQAAEVDFRLKLTVLQHDNSSPGGPHW